MRVKLDTPSWFYSRHASDWRMKLVFAREMGEYSPEVQTGLLFNIVYSAKFVCSRILPAFLKERFAILCSKIRAWLMSETDKFVLISQGDNPPIPKGGIVIWETYFVPPNDIVLAKDFAPGGCNLWIRQIEKYGPMVAKIAVRGRYSVELLRKFYPQFSHKVVDLSFIHPEYPEIFESQVKKKQRKHYLKILFVGRMAKYKGLERLMAALLSLRRQGVNNFELVIVSDYIDGAVSVPRYGWIHNKGGLSHEAVMQLFAESQIFVMPSCHESYGLVYLESMASGCVTFVPNEPVQREFVANGLAGVIVDSFDSQELESKLRVVLASTECRVRLAIHGLRRYRCVYSQKAERAKWVSVLNEIGAGHVRQ